MQIPRTHDPSTPPQPISKLVHCTKKWSFPLQISSVNWPNPQFPAEIRNGKLHFLCSGGWSKENLSILGVMQENLELTLPPYSLDKHQKLKDKILDSPCVSHAWIKPGKHPTLNKIFCSTSTPHTHGQLKHFKLQKQQN